MKQYIIEISQDIVEVAATKVAIPNGERGDSYLSALCKEWMTPGREPEWFERDDICHFSGSLLDSKTKVKVTCEGKKIDSFKTEDIVAQIHIANAFKLLTQPPHFGAIVGIAISSGVQTFKIELADYKRASLSFEASKIQFAVGFTHVECFAITELKLASDGNIDSVGKTEHAYYACLPSSTAPKAEYNKKYATEFRKAHSL